MPSSARIGQHFEFRVYIATPEYPGHYVNKRLQSLWNGAVVTFLMPGKTEENIPARYQHHVIPQIFPLDLRLLHNDDVRLQYVEHGLQCVSVKSILVKPEDPPYFEGPVLVPWQVPERIPETLP